MKSFKFIPFFLLFICLFYQTQGQEYHPLLGDSIVWSVTKTHEGTRTFKYYASGDTIINAKNYKKYYELTDLGTKFILGFIFEDTLSKKVYYLPRFSNEEFLLYDFSLNSGDSVFLEDIESGYSGWYIVDSISTIEILSGIRKILFLHHNSLFIETVWIEEIGSKRNLLAHAQLSDPIGNEVICVSKDGNLIYQSQASIDYNSCNIVLSREELSYELINIKVFPNPVNKHIDVVFHTKGPEKFEICLLDITGRRLQMIFSGISLPGSNRIHKEILPSITPGIYFIEFIDLKNGYCSVTKILKN